MAKEKTWLDFVHPVYADRADRWQLTSDFYTGEVLDGDKIEAYLIQKATAESEQAYLERVALADYTNHFATVVDSLAGMLFAIEGDANRDWSDWGDVSDRKTLAGRLMTNADGQEMGWITFWKRLAIELIINQLAWVLVDTTDAGDPIVRLWPAASVVNWSDDFKQVLCLETIDSRASLMDDPDDSFVQQWIYFSTDGWSRWRKDDEGHAIKYDEGFYDYRNHAGESIPPIFPAMLPLERHAGWSLAKKAMAIFNKESERDHLLRFGGFPKLRVVGDDDQYQAIIANISKGINALQEAPEGSKTHGYIAPDSGPASVMNTVLERKVTEFYAVAFREFGDSAKERTATEVRQEVSSGVGAFLSLLRSAIDDAENQSLPLIGQTEWPRNEEKWYSVKVERSEDFLPPDLDMIIDRLRKRYFGETGTVPTGPTTLLEAVRQITEWDGLVFNEDEAQTAIAIDQLDKLLPLFEALPLTEGIKVELTFDLAKALGKIEPGQEEAVKAEMLAVADERRRQSELLAQSFTAFEPGAGPAKEEDE